MHFRWFADSLDTTPRTSAALADDIDLSSIDSFVPMGGSTGFRGTFDGRGHALSGLSITTPDASGRFGLFGLVAAQGVVTNLVLTNVTVTSSSPPASLGIVCGRNLGTITFCSVFGRVTASTRNTDGAGSAMGGVCAENAGTIRACCVEDELSVEARTLDNDWKNMVVGGIAGTNAVSGTIEKCLFYARYDNDGANVVHGAVCGANAGTVRNCVGVHSNRNYFNGSVGVNSGTIENTLFPDPGNVFTNGAACYALNGSVTDGSQPWYQAIGTDALPRLSATPDPGATVYLHGDTYVNAWNLLQAQLNAGGVVTLTNDVTATSGDVSLTVANAVTLDLNGHTLTYNGKRNQVLSVVDGGDLTLTNSFPASGAVTGGGDHGVYVGEDSVFRLRGGAIAGNESGYAGGGVFVDRGTFEMTGGMITNNAAYDNNGGGGGVFVFNGIFTMASGEISGNTAIHGGGVCVDEYGEFTMTGGTISDNAADEGCGGGVCVYDGGAFTMAGGAISGNTAWEGSCVGVYSGEFTMTGGTISGNTVVWDGGVYVYDSTFTVSGSPVVSGNTNWDGEADNVYLCIGSVIAVDGLSAGASIGVTTEDEPPATITSGAATGDSQYFFSDNPGRRVEQTDGEVIIDLAYPAYLAGADEAVTNKWLAWAGLYGVGTNAEYEAAFLLDISLYTEIEPDESLLKIVEFGTTNILVSESGGYGSLAQAMGYEGDYLTFRRIVLASDVADLWQDDWGDTREICNGYLVLRTTDDLSLQKSGWEAISWPVEFEDGRAVIMFPEMFEEAIRGYFESVGGKAVNGLFLKACIETAPAENPALANTLIPMQ